MIDSSSVVDAILLKKRILGLTSDYMGLNEINYSLNNIKRYGVKHLNIEKDYHKSKEYILSHVNIKTPDNGNIFSINEGNYNSIDKRIIEYINVCKHFCKSIIISVISNKSIIYIFYTICRFNFLR